MDNENIEPSKPLAKKVLLIGWDGADWEHIDPLLEEGLLPTLEAFINDGVMGNLATLQPILSPMLWNSVATGKLADKHGIHGFIEPDPVNGGVRPYNSTSRKCKALWNIFTQQGMRSNVVGWWASHPAEPINGTIVSNSFNGTQFDPKKGWRIAPGTIHPAEKAATLAPCRVLPQELTHEHILPFIPLGERIDQENDPLLQSFGKVFSDCASTHAVATAIMDQEPWDFTAIYYDTIDHFSHAFMQFHPPQMPNAPDDKFEIYMDVIKGAYRFHDMMLERLLQLAGDNCTVIICSDHGFQSREQRPVGTPREPAGPAIWHREFGILAMKGPGIKKDERIYGASLIDIGPTVLSLFDLPIGEDMDGRPLVEAFDVEPEIKTIPSWEDVPGECGMHTGETAPIGGDSEELMQQFVALGYIEDPGDDKEKAAENAEIEAKYNVSRTLLWTKRPDEARPLLEDIASRRTWETRFWQLLVRCYHQGGYYRQAERVLRDLRGEPDEFGPGAKLLLGEIKLDMGDLRSAIDLFEQAEVADPRLPRLHIQLGDLYVRLRRFDDAERAFKKAIEIHEDSALAYQGLSTVYRRKGLNDETVDAALSAVGLLHRLPVAHFNLGVALARGGSPERAAFALETALKFRPNMYNAHRWLALLYSKELADPNKAAFHRDTARQLIAGQSGQKDLRLDRSLKTFDLPPIPSKEERRALLDQERPQQRPKSLKKSGKTFTLVSGLPRSGTSLMMQMLATAGMDAKTDGERAADVDNPEGYLEWEAIKQIAKKPELMDEENLDSKAIKVISMLLKSMPKNHDYKVIFMTRPVEEVAASQAKMIERLGTEGAKIDREQIEKQLRSHRDAIIKWMDNAAHMQVLEVDFPALVKSPGDFTESIIEFVGAERLPNADAMAKVVRPELHRQKRAKTAKASH